MRTASPKEIFDSFEILNRMAIVFKPESKYRQYSGLVTAALPNFETNELNEKITVLGIQCKLGWVTLKLTYSEARDLLAKTEICIGQTEEDTFTIV